MFCHTWHATAGVACHVLFAGMREPHFTLTSHSLHALFAALHFTLTDFTCTGVMGSSWELLQMMVWPFWPFTKK